jgi:hypothetical protein
MTGFRTIAVPEHHRRRRPLTTAPEPRLASRPSPRILPPRSAAPSARANSTRQQPAAPRTPLPRSTTATRRTRHRPAPARPPPPPRHRPATTSPPAMCRCSTSSSRPTGTRTVRAAPAPGSATCTTCSSGWRSGTATRTRGPGRYFLRCASAVAGQPYPRADDRIRRLPVLGRWAEEAGYDPQAVHPHMFRHTFANDWLAGGRSEGDLMR